MKNQRINKIFFLSCLSLLPTVGVTAGLIGNSYSTNSFKSSQINQSATLVEEENQKQLQRWDNDLSKYKYIDNDKTLFLGKNFLRLNNAVVFDKEQRKLIQQTTIGVYDELNNQLQSIVLSNDYKQLYFVDDNDPTKGFVVSDDLNNAIYYPIDLDTGLIDQTNAWAIATQEKASNVAAYLSTQVDERNDLIKNARIVSFSVNDNQLKVVVYNQNGSFEVENIPAINKAFTSIKIVKSFSINNALFTGINFFDDENNLVGSQIINIKNGAYVPGGASFDINRQINAMVYDADHNAIYAQYHFTNDNTTRMWYYSISPIDQFGQIGTMPNENYFSDLIFIKGEGIVGVNKQKNNLTLYPFERERILAAPTFKDVASSYTNDFFKLNSDKITNIIYDQKNQKFNVFYNSNIYVDGLVSFNLADFKKKSDIYSNIVPIYIDEAKLIDEMNKQEYQESFASVYAKNEMRNDFNKFLVIPEFYKNLENQSKIAQDKSWSLIYNSDENLGLINIKIKLKYGEKQLNLLDRDIFGFEAVNVNDIKTHYNKNSPLLDKTPTEIRRLLDDEKTVTETKRAIFDLYGFDAKYKQLPFDVKIKDSSVLGDISFIFSFLTIKDNKIQANFKKEQPKDSLVKQDATIDSNTGLLTFDNNFKLSIERWFIPVVVIAAILLMMGITTLTYFLLIQRKYPKLLASIKQRINSTSNNEDEAENIEINGKININQIKKNQDEYVDLYQQSEVKKKERITENLKLVTIEKRVDENTTRELTSEQTSSTKKSQYNDFYRNKKAATIDIFHQKMAQDQLSWNPEIKLTKQIG
ncbi:hypothetical protein LNO75_00160 [Mycoplasma sp. T363T]|uniref:hypothetical protein n=1 Tax=Mycoplasma bradburyae TaxID=2963128 RepID=UPI002340000F|nr:hypothetical protein [Mycoplasma bradburyae]MDC4162994.1 hypothetical protein [Mycoplasma bradburyae]